MWKCLTESSLASTLNQRELETYRQAQSLEGKDPINEILENTAALVRGYCRAAGGALSTDVLSVPSSLVGSALDYAAFDVAKRFKIAISEDRRRARTDAANLFELVRTGKFPVDPIDDTAENANSSSFATTPATIINPPNRLLD